MKSTYEVAGLLKWYDVPDDFFENCLCFSLFCRTNTHSQPTVGIERKAAGSSCDLYDLYARLYTSDYFANLVNVRSSLTSGPMDRLPPLQTWTLPLVAVARRSRALPKTALGTTSWQSVHCTLYQRSTAQRGTPRNTQEHKYTHRERRRKTKLFEPRQKNKQGTCSV